jgi:inner membrane protein
MVRAGWSLPRVGTADLTPDELARNGRSRSFERFEWFADGWIARDPAHLAVLGDMRYSLTTDAFDPIWGIRFTQPGTPVPVAWVNRSRDRKIDFGEMWREVIGTDSRYHVISGSVRPQRTDK